MSSRLDIEISVRVYERDGIESDAVSGEKLKVKSHWNGGDMVVLFGADLKKPITVYGPDLVKAIQRSMGA